MHHEAPVASKVVGPKLVVDPLYVLTKVGSLNIRLFLPHVQLLMQCVHQSDQKFVRVMLPSALELLVYFAKGALEAPRIHRKVGSRVPHFAHCLCKGHHEVPIVTHNIVWVDLVLVWWMLFSASLARIMCVLGSLYLGVIRNSREKVSNVRRVGNALHGRIHIASVAQVGAAFGA